MLRPLMFLFLLIGPGVCGAQAERVPSNDEPLSLEDIRALSEIFRRVRRDYVEEIGEKELFERAMRGMLSELDPYSTFLTAGEYRALEDSTLGRYGGVGIQVEPAADGLVVVAVVPESPAGKAGLRIADRLQAIDGQPIADLSFAAVRELVRGDPQSAVEITVRRDGISIPLKFSMAREYIPLQSVSARLIDDVAYINVDSFRSNTLAAARRLLATTAGNSTSIVLDLRGNSGGILNAGIGLADLFMTDGVIVSTRGRGQRSGRTYYASADTPYSQQPMIVLVDQQSASAAEIVAGALQDSGRATVAGSTTFGKGSVQTIQPLVNGAALKMTTSRYYTPSGRSIHEKGIQPDVVIKGKPEEVLREAIAALKKQVAAATGR